MHRSKTLLAALALALPVPALAACGGDSDEDPQDVIEAAFSNDTKIESGVLDLSLGLSAEGDQGGGLTVDLSGPFASDPENPQAVGQLDWDFSVSGEGAAAEALPGGAIEGAITATEDNFYVSYDGEAYELGEETYGQLLEQQEAAAEEAGVDDSGTFKEQCEQAIEAQGGDAAACDIDVTAWFSDLENEGTEDKGGDESTHVSGSLDVEQMISDLFQLGSSIPGATGGVDPALLEGQIGTISDAVDTAEFDLFAATEDDTLRGLDFTLGLDTEALGGASAGVTSASIDFSLEFSEVGEEQTFSAPDDPQPIDELLGQFGIPGLSEIPGAELPGAGGAGGGGGSLPGTPDPDCIAEAAGDAAEIQKCLE